MQKIAPYVSERRKRRKKVQRYLWITLAVFVLYFLFFGVAWFILRSPFFRVSKIVVDDPGGNVATDTVVALAQAEPSGGHMGFLGAIAGWGSMFAWPSSIPSSTVALAPDLAGVTVSKDYFAHTVTLTATEREPFGIWCYIPGSAASPDTADESCYWFDAEGVLFEKSLSTEGNLVVVVNDYSQSSRGLGNTVLPDEFNANFLSVMNVVRATGLGVKEMDLNSLSLEEIDVRTAEGPVLEFSLRFPADDYLPVLQSLIAQSGFNKLQYIDCRTEDRVFYK